MSPATPLAWSRSEQRPALAPDRDGFVRRGGVGVHWEVYGQGHRPTVLLLPTWAIVNARFWKLQVPFLSRRHRVVLVDGRGNGRSDRPAGAEAYRNEEYVADALAVCDATGTDRAVVVGLSSGATWGVMLAAEHPDRVAGLVAIAAACDFPHPQSDRDRLAFSAPPASDRGWAKYNRHYWLDGGYDDFVDFFCQQMYVEPHSSKQIEDALGWAHRTTAQVLVDTSVARMGLDGIARTPIEDACRRVRCPVLVIHGTEDRIRPAATGARLAELTRGKLVLLQGSGHAPNTRDPVKINRLIGDFVARACAADDPPAATPADGRWQRAADRRRRVLYLSSPIGLGHARRDVAIARELRHRLPDVQVAWLAQDPVTRVLAAEGETVHPASTALLSESTHIEGESGEHDLHAFQAIRRMDEVLVNNFLVCQELLESEHFDLVVGDEAWDLDYFLHENPELKRSAYAWLTDFVGWLPMPVGGDAEAALTADYNAEMIEQRARFPLLRDRSIFVGNPADVVTDPFGPGLPGIRDWTQANFDFAGYITGFTPPDAERRAALRRSFGYGPEHRVCLVTVGGSGVGTALLRRALAAVPLARRLLPELHFLVVTGPRIAPASLPRPAGARLRGYLPNLPDYLAAADVAVVQGGLSTCMELTAAGTPFLYVPLANHFEQNIHVRQRLRGYRAGHLLPYQRAREPELLAQAIVAEVSRPVHFRPVETDGAARAAGMLADLL